MPLPRRGMPRPIQHRPVLAALKAKPCGRRGSAGLDRHCARAASEGARRNGRMPVARSNKRMKNNNENGKSACVCCRD